ncbi:hypothetical protein SCYAM73S_00239 [Streptomyces cyaneofuscatus]
MRRLFPAPVQMMPARIAASRASMTVSTPPMSSLALPSAPVWVSSGRPMRTVTARPRPTQAAAMVPLMGLPVIFHTMARSIRPPSRGRPGSRLKAATMRLEIIRPAIRTPGTVPGSTNRIAP